MNFFVKCLLLLLLACTVSSCKIFPGRYTSNNPDGYLASDNGREIVVPPPLTRANITNYYRLPRRIKPAKVSIVPPGMKLVRANKKKR